jgi:uncharacterized membrane protein YesL
MQIFKIIWRSLKTVYEELFFFSMMGLATVLATVPIVTAPFAWAGMWYIAHRAVEGRSTKWRDYWEGVKTYGPRNVANTLLVGLFFGLALGNLWFYNNPEISPLSPQVALWLSGAWIAGMIVGAGVALYLLSFQMEMEEPRFWISLRNSLFLTLLRPVPTFIFVLVAVILAVSIWLLPPILILYPGLVGVISVNTVQTLLEPILAAQEEEEEDTTTT